MTTQPTYLVVTMDGDDDLPVYTSFLNEKDAWDYAKATAEALEDGDGFVDAIIDVLLVEGTTVTRFEREAAVEPGNLGITEEGLAACYICGGTHSHDHPEEFQKCDVPDCIKHGPIGYGKKFYCPQHWEDFQVLWDLEGLPAAMKLTNVPLEEDMTLQYPFDVPSMKELMGDEWAAQYEWLSDKDWQEISKEALSEFALAASDLYVDCVLGEVGKFNPPEPDYESMVDRNEDR